MNGKNGHPLPKQQVSVSFLYDKNEVIPAKYDAVVNLETDRTGTARFTLPKPIPEHLSIGAHLTSEHWHCGCAAPLLVATGEVLQKGVVKGQQFSSSSASAEAHPGEGLFVARPFTFLERLLYPIMKE